MNGDLWKRAAQLLAAALLAAVAGAAAGGSGADGLTREDVREVVESTVGHRLDLLVRTLEERGAIRPGSVPRGGR